MKFISGVDQDISRTSKANKWDILFNTRNGFHISKPSPLLCQKSVDAVRRQLLDLSSKLGQQVRSIFTSHNSQAESVKETKPPLLSQHCVVYQFNCNRCDADYVGSTCRHIHQRIEEHKTSAVGLSTRHTQRRPQLATPFSGQFQKCPNDFQIVPNDIQIFQVNFRRFQMRFRNLHVNFRYIQMKLRLF